MDFYSSIFKEGWGFTVIEAASQGTPTVGYNVAGLRDSVKNGKTGVLVDAKNTEQLANAVIQIIKKKEEYNKLSSNALAWSKQFTWDKSVKKSWDVIQYVYEQNI